MKENIIRQEFERRGKNDDDAYKLIGAELKRKRLNQSQTLSSIAGDVCSVSYLCKVEKSQIKPNRIMLKEICKRLNIESPQMNLLFQMKEFIINLAIYYNNNQFKEIENIYLKCKDFDNYKSRLISFIYFISIKDIAKADEVSKELFKLMNVMRDYELTIFVLFHSILLYYHESYIEAIDNLNEVVNSEKHQQIINLAEKFIFYCYYKLNKPVTIKFGEKLLERYLHEMNYLEINKIRYYLGLFFIKNRMLDEANEQIVAIDDISYKNSLIFIIDLINNNKTNIKIDTLRPFAKLLYLYHYNKKDYRKNYHEILLSSKLEADFNDNIANYLTINNDLDKYKEIEQIYIPNVIKSRNLFDWNFFLGEFCRLSIEMGKYKPFVKSYMDMIKEVKF